MKKFSIGMLTGYLLTSIFSISAPPAYFWYLLGVVGTMCLLILNAWRRFNNDIYEGEY